MSKRKNSLLPPGLAIRFFKWYCRNELRDSILGDLEEQFNEDCDRYGLLMAKLRFWINVLRFINRHTLKNDRPMNNYHTNPLVMIASYLSTSIRYLHKHASYAVINVVGLSIGLASCMLIFYYINHELSFDRFHENHKNVFRILTDNPDNSGNFITMVNTAPAITPGLRAEFPEVKRASQLRYAMRTLFSKGENSFYEDFGYYADSSFLEILPFRLKDGFSATALDEPNSIVMTESMASKYFDDVNPIGELITMNNDLILKVTGILDEVPSNSHIRFDYLVSFSTYTVPEGYFSDLTSWRWLGFLTYIELNEGANPQDVKLKLDEIYKSKTREGSSPPTARIQPLGEAYLGSLGMVDDLASHLRSGNSTTIYALGIIALLILVIASFNFMNLTSAFSINRGREIGLRKVLGAGKTQLLLQLLTESIMVTILSLILAYALAITSFPYLKYYLSWDIQLNWSQVLQSFPYTVLVAVLIGVAAGLYPSLTLSKSKTIDTLKGKLRGKRSMAGKVRNTLVVIQFCISIGLIAGTMLIIKQMDHLRNQALGFEKENVLVMKLLPTDMTKHYDAFKNLSLQYPDVLSISRGERKMGDPWPPNNILVDGRDRSEERQVIGNLVGYDFLKTMGIELVEGRSFSKAFAQDSTEAIIISEKTVSHLGLEHPIGEKLNFFNLNGPRTVIGVMKDFNFSSLHEGISPTVLVMPFIDMEHMFVRISPGSLVEKVAHVEEIWEQVAPGTPLEIEFMDDNIESLYAREEKLGTLISGFSVVAIILACLGLYGLVAFMVNNRLKEVGIRKVLGATILSVVKLFVQRYVGLIILASLIAIPGTHYLLNQWLEGFAYRTTIPWWIYSLSSTTLLLVALVTISFQTIKAALINPVEVLKNDQ